MDLFDSELDLIVAIRLRSDGQEDLGRSWRRRKAPAARRVRRRIAGLGWIGRPGLDFERSFDWEQGRDTEKPSRAATRASMAGAELAAAHGGQQRRRALPSEIAREGGRIRVLRLYYLEVELWGGLRSSGKRWNCGATESSELGRSFNNGG